MPIILSKAPHWNQRYYNLPMCETKTKVHDISQELYKNLCEMRTAANLLQDLAYPSLR